MPVRFLFYHKKIILQEGLKASFFRYFLMDFLKGKNFDENIFQKTVLIADKDS